MIIKETANLRYNPLEDCVEIRWGHGDRYVPTYGEYELYVDGAGEIQGVKIEEVADALDFDERGWRQFDLMLCECMAVEDGIHSHGPAAYAIFNGGEPEIRRRFTLLWSIESGAALRSTKDDRVQAVLDANGALAGLNIDDLDTIRDEVVTVNLKESPDGRIKEAHICTALR